MTASIAYFVAERPSQDVRASLESLRRLEDVAHIAVMPDVHLAHSVCIGVALATHEHLFPDAVGGDIGCGMAALPLNAPAERLAGASVAREVLARLAAAVPWSAHPSRVAHLPDELARMPLSCAQLRAKQGSIGRVQFATLGRGNHFVELQSDAEGSLWLMLHSGSRGMGQAIREHHAGAHALQPIASRSSEGQAYLRDMEWALHYARCSRKAMATAIVAELTTLLGVRAGWSQYLDCHHNFARWEMHGDAHYWVHRKGAISASEGEAGIIPGSMGTASYHTLGRGLIEALASSSHGAGRVLSRGDARRKVSALSLQGQMQGVWFDNRLVRQLREEAPSAYKDIASVMRAQRKLTRTVRRLEPVLVYKAM